MASLWDLHSGTAAPASREEDDQPWLLTSALKTGAGELAGAAASGIEAFGRGLQARPIESFGSTASQAAMAYADRNRRADLETAPWREGGASVLPWLGYQTLKQGPQLAAFLTAGRFTRGITPAGLARVGAAAPEIIGGGGLRGAAAASADFATKRAALEAGQTFAQRAVGSMVVGVPVAAGSMYQEAQQAAEAEGRETTTGEALASIAASPFYAALDALDVNILGGLSRGVRQAGARGLVRKVARGALVDAAAELPQEGIQTALEQSFRTDLTPQEKMQNIVDGAITGAAVGGTLGGIASLRPTRKIQTVDPNTISDDTLGATVDAALNAAGGGAPPAGGAEPTGPGPAGPTPPAPVPRGQMAPITAPGDEDFDPADPYGLAGRTLPVISPGDIPRAGWLSGEAPPAPAPAPPVAQAIEALTGASAPAAPDLVPGTTIPKARWLSEPPAAAPVATEGAVDRLSAAVEEAQANAATRLPARDAARVAAGLPTVAEAKAAREAAKIAETPFSVEDTLKGISTRKSYKDATNEEELRQILAARLEGGSTAKGDIKLAERLAIDLNAPTAAAAAEDPAAALAPEVVAEPPVAAPAAASEAPAQPVAVASPSTGELALGAPLAPGKAPTRETVTAAPAVKSGTIDKEFQASWSKDLEDKKGTKILELRRNLAANPEEADRQLFEMLGTTTRDARGETQETAFTGKSVVTGDTGVRTLAMARKIIDKDGQLTDKGMKLARAVIPDEMTAQAALDAGYTGSDVAAFERGARGGKLRVRNDMKAALAYEAGASWATNRAAPGAPIPAVAGETATEEFSEGKGRKAGALASEKTGKTVMSPGVPAEKREQQITNLALDRAYGGSLDPAQMAQLKTLARGTATPEDLDDAARYFKTGHGSLLFENYPREKVFTGERPLPSVVTQKTLDARVQAAREAQVAANSLVERLRNRTVSPERQKQIIAKVRAAEHDFQKEETRYEIERAYAANEITGEQRIALTHALMLGEFAQIATKLNNAQVSHPIIAPANPIRNRAQWTEIMTHQHGLMSIVTDRRNDVASADRQNNPVAADSARKALLAAQYQLGQHIEEWGDYLDQWGPVIKGEVDEQTALGGDIENVQKAQEISRRAFLTGVAATAMAGATGASITSRVKSGTVPAPAIAPRTVASAALQQQIKVGQIVGALRVIQRTSTSSAYKTLAAKLLRADWSNVRLNSLPDDLGLKGLTTLEDDGSSRVDIFGVDGTSEETFLHEMIHAFIQQRWAAMDMYSAHNKAMVDDAIDRQDEAIRGFQSLWRHIGEALEATNPELVQNETWANQIYQDPDELLAWVMTNHDAQKYLQSVDRDGKPVDRSKSLWTDFLNWVASLFGGSYSPQFVSALDEILGAGMSIIEGGLEVTNNEFGRKIAAQIAEQRGMRVRGEQLDPMASVLNYRRPALDAAPGTQEVSNAQYRDTIAKVVEAADKLPLATLKDKTRTVALGWSSVHNISQFWGVPFNLKDEGGNTIIDPVTREPQNGVKGYERAINLKNAIVARLARFYTDVRDDHGALERDSAEQTVQLMTATEFGINPTRPWKEQSKDIREHENSEVLKELHAKYFKAYRSLQTKGHSNVYDKMRAVNEMMMLLTLSQSLHQQVDVDGNSKGVIPEFLMPPMDEFMAAQEAREFSAADARDWWSDKLRSQQIGLEKFLLEQDTIIASTPPTAKTEGMQTSIDALGERLKGITATVRKMEDAPYFHLGRYGQFFIGWKVPNQQALGKIGDALADAGFKGVISEASDQLRVYMRLETIEAQASLEKLLRKLQQQGLVEKENFKVGKRAKNSFPSNFAPQWANQMISAIELDTAMDDDVKQMEINSLRALALDMMPETALARVMTPRKNIPGYDPDMMRNFEWRGQVGANAAAGSAVAPKITASFVDQRAAIKAVQAGDTASVDQRAAMTEVTDELSRREKERAMWPETKALDQISSITSAWFLGLSVSYGFVNFTQLPATLLPELGKKHGFVESAKAISRAAPIAFKIMRQVWKHGMSISLDRAQDAVITHDALKKVVGTEMAAYLMRVVNTGNLDIGGPSRELARAAEGRGDDKVDRALRYASSIGYYTETMSRLIAAIATKQLNPKMSVEQASDHAAHILNETMWNYSITNQGRMFGKMGAFGAATPLMTKFMQFQAQLGEKLIREVYTATKGTGKEKQEARAYLRQHLVAMTVLAGSLSLPGLTLMATIVNGLKDLLDDDEEPTNVREDYRNWLNATVGQDAGEVLSHGVFRGLGFDIATRIGEQDIIPFSRFLSDRRQYKDSIPDLLGRTWGAPASLARNILEGGQKLVDGDMIGGMARMLPNGLAGPTKAIKLYNEGYIDANGRRMPVDPGPLDVIFQLFGFNPSRNAEYSEQANNERQRLGYITRRNTILGNQIVNAIERGDTAGARDMIVRAQHFDQANPEHAILPSLSERINRRASQGSVARATHTPIGTNVRDPEAMARGAYANY